MSRNPRMLSWASAMWASLAARQAASAASDRFWKGLGRFSVSRENTTTTMASSHRALTMAPMERARLQRAR